MRCRVNGKNENEIFKLPSFRLIRFKHRVQTSFSSVFYVYHIWGEKEKRKKSRKKRKYDPIHVNMLLRNFYVELRAEFFQSITSWKFLRYYVRFMLQCRLSVNSPAPRCTVRPKLNSISAVLGSHISEFT